MDPIHCQRLPLLGVTPTVAVLDHECIVTQFGWVQEADSCELITERYSQTLAADLELCEALDVVHRVTSALQYVRPKGIVLQQLSLDHVVRCEHDGKWKLLCLDTTLTPADAALPVALRAQINVPFLGDLIERCNIPDSEEMIDDCRKIELHRRCTAADVLKWISAKLSTSSPHSSEPYAPDSSGAFQKPTRDSFEFVAKPDKELKILATRVALMAHHHALYNKGLSVSDPTLPFATTFQGTRFDAFVAAFREAHPEHRTYRQQFVLVLKGAKGTGKTSFAKHMAREQIGFAEGGDLIVFVPLAELARKALNPELLDAVGLCGHLGINNEVIAHLESVRFEKVLWVLDGYDEAETPLELFFDCHIRGSVVPRRSFMHRVLVTTRFTHRPNAFVTARPLHIVHMEEWFEAEFRSFKKKVTSNIDTTRRRTLLRLTPFVAYPISPLLVDLITHAPMQENDNDTSPTTRLLPIVHHICHQLLQGLDAHKLYRNALDVADRMMRFGRLTVARGSEIVQNPLVRMTRQAAETVGCSFHHHVVTDFIYAVRVRSKSQLTSEDESLCVDALLSSTSFAIMLGQLFRDDDRAVQQIFQDCGVQATLPSESQMSTLLKALLLKAQSIKSDNQRKMAARAFVALATAAGQENSAVQLLGESTIKSNLLESIHVQCGYIDAGDLLRRLWLQTWRQGVTVVEKAFAWSSDDNASKVAVFCRTEGVVDKLGMRFAHLDAPSLFVSMQKTPPVSRENYLDVLRHFHQLDTERRKIVEVVVRAWLKRAENMLTTVPMNPPRFEVFLNTFSAVDGHSVLATAPDELSIAVLKLALQLRGPFVQNITFADVEPMHHSLIVNFIEDWKDDEESSARPMAITLHKARGWESLMQSICSVPRFTTINIRQALFDSTAAVQDHTQLLRTSLGSASHLHELDISETLINDEGVIAIAAGIKELKTSALQLLRLQRTGFGLAGLTALRKALSEVKLTTLDVSANPLGDAGCGELASLVNQQSSLTWFAARDCQIGDVGCSAIAEQFSQGSSPLAYIDLGLNRIGAVGGESLSASIEARLSTTLRTLRVDGNVIDFKTLSAILSHLDKAARVEARSNAFSDDQWIEYFEPLMHSRASEANSSLPFTPRLIKSLQSDSVTKPSSTSVRFAARVVYYARTDNPSLVLQLLGPTATKVDPKTIACIFREEEAEKLIGKLMWQHGISLMPAQSTRARSRLPIGSTLLANFDGLFWFMPPSLPEIAPLSKSSLERLWFYNKFPEERTEWKEMFEQVLQDATWSWQQRRPCIDHLTEMVNRYQGAKIACMPQLASALHDRDLQRLRTIVSIFFEHHDDDDISGDGSDDYSDDTSSVRSRAESRQ